VRPGYLRACLANSLTHAHVSFICVSGAIIKHILLWSHMAEKTTTKRKDMSPEEPSEKRQRGVDALPIVSSVFLCREPDDVIDDQRIELDLLQTDLGSPDKDAMQCEIVPGGMTHELLHLVVETSQAVLCDSRLPPPTDHYSSELLSFSSSGILISVSSCDNDTSYQAHVQEVDGCVSIRVSQRPM
jgi:hypothetical protein